MMIQTIQTAQQQIIETGHVLNRHGWVPATGGNLSVRLGDGHVAITVSGKHKGHLGPDDIMTVDQDGRAQDGKKPSAETRLHTGLYKIRPDVQAIAHAHPRAAVTWTLVFNQADRVVLAGYELMKVYPGIQTHETSVVLPIFNNSQDMSALQKEIDAWYAANPETPPVYLVRGHGITAGAADLSMAFYMIEATEEMLAYEIEQKKFNLNPLFEGRCA